MMLRTLVLTASATLLVVSLVAVTAPAEPQAEPQNEPPPAQEECAPPCGYIWPRIGVNTPLPTPYLISEIREFPQEVQVDITYSWDMEQEGTGLSDLSKEMKITTFVTRTPEFMRAELDRNVCTFLLIPVQTHYDVCTLTLSVEIDEDALPGDEDELRDGGHRLGLFATSEDSGTFMKSYGLEDIRFEFDALPDGVSGNSGPGDAETAESPMGLLALCAFGLAASLGLTRRRR